MKRFSLIILVLAIGCTVQRSRLAVVFPKVSEPEQITKNGKEHLFASYYGINSFSKSQKYATVLETDVKFRLPDENDTATLGLVDLNTHEFIPIAKTSAWNFQQGCMAHWLGSSPDSLIVFNDQRGGKFVSVILNVHTKKELKVIPYPVCAVSPNGREALSINFARMRITRTDYGYAGNGQESKSDVSFPEDDGLFRIDLETGKAKLILAVAQVKEMVPKVPEGGLEYFNHTLYSKDGSKIFLLARATPNWNTTSFILNSDGSEIRRCFPDSWEGSHFDWLNGNELMVTAKYKTKQYAHVLFTAGTNNYKRLGNGLLDFDGHGTFSPDRKWMTTDTYPGEGMREQKIFLMDVKTEAVISLGRFPEPEEYRGGWRCDIHCRWSPNGDIIGFNSTQNGSRQVYVMKLDL